MNRCHSNNAAQLTHTSFKIHGGIDMNRGEGGQIMAKVAALLLRSDPFQPHFKRLCCVLRPMFACQAGRDICQLGHPAGAGVATLGGGCCVHLNRAACIVVATTPMLQSLPARKQVGSSSTVQYMSTGGYAYTFVTVATPPTSLQATNIIQESYR